MATAITTDAGAWLPFLLQTADPLFPTGAYAHSLGAEEMTRLGVLRDEASLLGFLRMHTMPVLERQELPYLRFALDASGCSHGPVGRLDVAHATEPGEDGPQGRGYSAQLCALDREIDAWKLAQETREASVQIGVRRLRALTNICPDSPVLAEFARDTEQGAARGHHLIVFALQASLAGVPRDAALMTWAYQALAAVCAAALKLIRIGQDAIQRALRAACAELPRVIERSCAIVREEAGCFSPMLEIASMRHERAFERLFIS
jgi:urease accessory protein